VSDEARSPEARSKVVLISGGSRGLGRALVESCQREGYIIATYSRSTSPFIQEQIERDPERRAFVWEAIDAADAHAVKRFAAGVVRAYGRIDALINNAGVFSEGLLSTMKLSDIDSCVDRNIKGALYLCWACTRFMLRQNSGSVVNISSLNAIRGHAGVAVYSATKAALDGLTRSLARELGPRNIRVNSVAPGYFESDMVAYLSSEAKDRIVRRTPLGRLGTVDDIVGLVMFLLSPEASFITGQTIVVDGGITC
jgi:3-oxoacyl-[acyl-carrier protein] reductase